eukprot:3073718-Prymnesium_polylepis.1
MREREVFDKVVPSFVVKRRLDRVSFGFTTYQANGTRRGAVVRRQEPHLLERQSKTDGGDRAPLCACDAARPAAMVSPADMHSTGAATGMKSNGGTNAHSTHTSTLPPF